MNNTSRRSFFAKSALIGGMAARSNEVAGIGHGIYIFDLAACEKAKNK